MNHKPKNWIKNLALEAETAIMYLPYTEQEGMRYMVARNIQSLYKQHGNSDAHNMNKRINYKE
jgi:hypothetical protein